MKNACHNPKCGVYTPERNKLMNRLVAAEFHLNFVCLFLTVLGLHCCMRVFSSCSKRGCLYLWCVDLIVVASVSWSMGSRARGLSVVVVHGLSCPMNVESSQTRDWTCVPYTSRQTLNHWTTREVPLESWWAKFYYMATLRQASICLLSSHSGDEQEKQDASECCEWLLLHSCI